MKRIERLILVSLICIVLISCNSVKYGNVNIWMVGDSTMACKKPEREPESGWGEGLKKLAKKGVTVHNHAASGRSSLSYISERRWEDVCDSLNRGDFVIIQFGHNDEKPDPELYTEPFGAFTENLSKFIRESREHGACPIICTSIVRRHFDGNGNLLDTHGDYLIAARETAAKESVDFVDMEKLTRDLISRLGAEESKSLFNFTHKKQDSTHVNYKGALIVAELFAKDVKQQSIPLARFLGNDQVLLDTFSADK